MIETFDWETAEKMNKVPAKLELLKELYNKVVSEEEYVKRYTSISREGVLHAADKLSKNRAHHSYRKLKEKFGFFTGELK